MKDLKPERQWNALKVIMSKIMKSMSDISSFSLLLLIFIYIFALFGMEIFSSTALLDLDGNLVLGRENV